MNTIVVFQSGLPLAMPSAITRQPIQLPDDQSTLTRYFNTCTVTVAGVRQNCASPTEPAFVQQPPYTLRTLSTRITSIRDQRRPNVDFAVQVCTDCESMRIEFERRRST